MTRLQLMGDDCDILIEVSLQTVPDVEYGFTYEDTEETNGKHQDEDSPYRLTDFEDEGIKAIVVGGEHYESVFDRKTKTAYPISGFKASSAEELMLKLDAKGLTETIPDPPQTPAGVRALAAENKKLKDKIAKMREMLK